MRNYRRQHLNLSQQMLSPFFLTPRPRLLSIAGLAVNRQLFCWLLRLIFCLSTPGFIFLFLVDYRRTGSTIYLVLVIAYCFLFPFYLIWTSISLVFEVLPTIKGMLNSNQRIVVVAGRDGGDDDDEEEEEEEEQE